MPESPIRDLNLQLIYLQHSVASNRAHARRILENLTLGLIILACLILFWHLILPILTIPLMAEKFLMFGSIGVVVFIVLQSLMAWRQNRRRWRKLVRLAEDYDRMDVLHD